VVSYCELQIFSTMEVSLDSVSKFTEASEPKDVVGCRSVQGEGTVDPSHVS
jgi:hypothetical protein